MKALSSFLMLLLVHFAHAQEFRFVPDNSVPVRENGAFYTSPWEGGLNAAQYGTLDFNFDGKEDLVLFDRMAQKIITYQQTEGQYVFAPQFEELFPPVYNWVLIRDFNCDGKKDIFTGHVFGIFVYENTSTDNQISFRHFPFYDGNSVSEVVLTEGLSGRINLQLQFDDLPAISDADGDGDIDIFTMNYGGNGTVQYHRNFSQERYGSCDSLDFELADPWWGGVRECDCDEFVFDNGDCNSGGRVEHAAGKSLSLLDGDGDGFLDILIAEADCPVLNMLDNNGPVSAPAVTSAPRFPLGTSEPSVIYPTGYLEDLDFDGVSDLIVTPTTTAKSSYDVDLSQSNWFYKNVGTNSQPDFALQTRAFLQNRMIDAGDHVVPAFADMDGDGDFDLFLSNNESPATVRVYKNTGSPFEPQFEFSDGDYIGLSQENFTMMKIQFGDINADGNADLVFVATDSDSGLTGLYYVLNKQSNRLDFTGKAPQRLDFQVARGENVSLIHVDADGQVDLLRGRSNGAVEYWRNQGSLQFSLVNPAYLNMSANVVTTRLAFAAADLDLNGSTDLLIGDETGRLRVLSNFRNASDVSEAVTDIISYESDASSSSPNLGGRIWPATAPLYGSKPLVAVGTILGGVRLLRSEDDDTPATVIKVYPNPVSPTIEKLTILSNQAVSLEIYSAKGEAVLPLMSIPAKQPVELALNHFAPGVYLLRFSESNKIHIRRLVVY